MPKKLYSSTYQLDTTFQITILSSSVTLNCPPSPTLNILGLSFTYNLNWKLHISSVAKTASMKLGVLSRLRQFYSPPQLLTLLYRGLIRPCTYGVCFTCLGRLHSFSSIEQGGIKSSPSSYQLLSSDWLSSASVSSPQCCLSCSLLPLFSC